MSLLRARRAPWNDTTDRFGLLVLLLVAVLLMSGVSDQGWVRLWAGVFNVAAFVVGFKTSRARTTLWAFSGLLVTGIASAILVGALRVGEPGAALGAIFQVALLGALTLAVLSRILRHEEVTEQTILGAVSAYLLIGQVFAWIYLALHGIEGSSVLKPSEAGEIPVYYSYVVLTTLGFGDVTPTTELAQRLTVLEALMGQLFLTILLARLVSVYSRVGRSASDTP